MLLVFDFSKFREFLLNTFGSRNHDVTLVGTKVDFEKNALKVSYMIDYAFNKPNIAGRDADWISGSAELVGRRWVGIMVVLFCKMFPKL